MNAKKPNIHSSFYFFLCFFVFLYIGHREADKLSLQFFQRKYVFLNFHKYEYAVLFNLHVGRSICRCQLECTCKVGTYSYSITYKPQLMRNDKSSVWKTKNIYTMKISRMSVLSSYVHSTFRMYLRNGHFLVTSHCVIFYPRLCMFVLNFIPTHPSNAHHGSGYRQCYYFFMKRKKT